MTVDTQNANVTIDDVRSALGETDPNATNANKVRALLGNRGSFATIQKHLATLRQELATASAPPVAADSVPAMPTEAANQMWVAAWTAAQVATMSYTQRIAAERDAALVKLETMGADVAGLVATVDEQAAQIEQAEQEAAAAAAAHLADLEKSEAEMEKAAVERAELVQEIERIRAEMTRESERARAELAKEKADALHAADLSDQRHLMMRMELDRLTDQVGELKAHLYKRAEASQG